MTFLITIMIALLMLCLVMKFSKAIHLSTDLFGE